MMDKQLQIVGEIKSNIQPSNSHTMEGMLDFKQFQMENNEKNTLHQHQQNSNADEKCSLPLKMENVMKNEQEKVLLENNTSFESQECSNTIKREVATDNKRQYRYQQRHCYPNAHPCRNLFSDNEYKLYQLCKAKGRRGIVTSLCFDQSISYVRDLNSNYGKSSRTKDSESDRWLVFRYTPVEKNH